MKHVAMWFFEYLYSIIELIQELMFFQWIIKLNTWMKENAVCSPLWHVKYYFARHLENEVWEAASWS